MPTYRIYLNLVNEKNLPSEDRVIYGDGYDSVENLLKSVDWVGKLVDRDMLIKLKKELENERYREPACIFMQEPEFPPGHFCYYGVPVKGRKQISIPGVWYLAIARDEY